MLLLLACWPWPDTRPAQAQNTDLVIDQAVTLPSLATPGSGSILDLAEYTDAQGNTYQAGSLPGVAARPAARQKEAGGALGCSSGGTRPTARPAPVAAGEPASVPLAVARRNEGTAALWKIKRILTSG